MTKREKRKQKQLLEEEMAARLMNMEDDLNAVESIVKRSQKKAKIAE